MAVYRKKIILQIIFLFIVVNVGYSQNSKSYFYENEFDFSLPLKGKWSMDFGFGNRGMFQERNAGKIVSGYQHEHLEMKHFTTYQASELIGISLGAQYRFRELFDSSKEDEFRLTEQVEIQSANSPLSHRFRLEQRFREHIIHRGRYDIAYSMPLNQYFSWTLGTEALYAISSQLKPEAEQRISLSLANSYFQDLELGLSLEYRMENYTRNLDHEFFIISGLTIDMGN
ncbi:DUF2490 domain-containing protein [Gramella jeungdoensis]|uniref:DUF2490 domain-containing protein n=1 Tax=Gramella jeungdoensis TaxID=708091 RepID=A0ABT0Z6L4_9FLAO|nr:DUF2490 domain-containing protein [Gramella jeungdoensis]